MMKTLILASVWASVLAASATAASAASAPSSDTCLRSQFLRNHTVGDDHTLYFDYNGTAVYRVTTSNNCLSAAVSSDPIVMENRSGSLMCKAIDWDVSVRGTKCIVTGVSKLSPAEVAALPKGTRP